jgi:FkbM family methyltransferase
VNPVQPVKSVLRPYWRRGKHALLPKVLRKPQVDCTREAIGGREGDPDRFGRLTLNPELLSSQSVVYAFGVGDDITFDVALTRRFGCVVHAFDPAPRSIEWVKTQSAPAEWVFHEYGIADFDGTITLYPPNNPDWVADTAYAKQYAAAKGTECPVYRLPTITRLLGHARVDLLKMNIEGAEYAAIEDLLKSEVAVRQLLISFHHNFKEIGMGRTLAAIRALNEAGYLTFSISYNGEEVAFLHRSAVVGRSASQVN